MFKSKQQIDLKKVSIKFSDTKKDCLTRLRHLKVLIESKDLRDSKEFFISQSRIIYNIFFESFIQLDSAAKFRGKVNREDVDLLLLIFEKILILLPEKIEQKWQLNSIVFIFRKFLHPNNVQAIRQEGLRLFLIFYQILGETTIRSMPQIEILYASLIPGLVTDLGRIASSLTVPHHLTDSPNIRSDQGNINQHGSGSANSLLPHFGVQQFPNEPFMPSLDHVNPIGPFSSANVGIGSNMGSGGGPGVLSSSSSSSLYSNQSNYSQFDYKADVKLHCTRWLLEYSISQCGKIYWRDYRDRRHIRSFEFLISSFSRIYLPYIFPKIAATNNESDWRIYTVRNIISIYDPAQVDTSQIRLRKPTESHYQTGTQHHQHLASMNQIQAIVIQWFTRYLLGKEKSNSDTLKQDATLTPHTPGASFSSDSGPLRDVGSHSHSNLTHSSSVNISTSHGNYTLVEADPSTFEYQIVRSLLNSKRCYVDLVLSLFHETFLLPFTEEMSITMRDVIKVYRQWICNDTDNKEPPPLFLSEPTLFSTVATTTTPALYQKACDDSVCAGMMNLLNIFIVSSANVFLLEVPAGMGKVLELQVDVCKRVFNIYRFMVMKVEMDKTVWENLVQVLIKITSCILSKDVPKKREDTLGGRLAPPLFQTLVVTWIKANLNVQISPQLWQKFYELTSSLTKWEELIHEWSNTMCILNRVMSRSVFNINLNDLPLDKHATKQRIKNGNPIQNRIAQAALNKSNTAAASANSNGLNSGSKPNSHSAVSHQNSNGGSTAVHDPNQKHGHQSGVSNGTPHSPGIVDSTKYPSSNMVQRLVSSESNCSNDSHSVASSHGGQFSRHRHFIKPIPSVHQSQICHQLYHDPKNSNLPNRIIFRSLSDSCLLLSIENSMCGIRTSLRSYNQHNNQSNHPHQSRRGSYYRSTQKNQHRRNSRHNSSKRSNRHNQRHLPMIDDDVDDDDSCTLADVALHYDHDIDGDLSDNESLAMMNGNDDFYDDHSYYQSYIKQRLYQYRSLRDLRDLSSILHHNRNGSIWSDASETLSIGTSGPECNSLKDTPMAFDSTSATSTCNSSVTEQMNIPGIGSSISSSINNAGASAGGGLLVRQSSIDSSNNITSIGGTSSPTWPVLLGGTHKGWNAEVSVVLWRRMLGILGDINDIEDPAMHKLVFDCLVKITEDFIKMKDNISYLNGASQDNGCTNVPDSTSTNTVTRLQPSLHYFTAWLFRATELPPEFKDGKLLAYKLLCIIALHRCEQELDRDFLILFYMAIKRALGTYDMKLTCTIIRYCGAKFFSSPLFGSSCLLFDFISAANMIVSSQQTEYPRVEALHLLGSLIGFFDIFSSVLILKNGSTTPTLEPYNDLKEHVLEILISASKREQTGLGRSIALSSLGIFLYKEFLNRSQYHRLKEIVNILIAATRVSVKRPKHGTNNNFSATSSSASAPSLHSAATAISSSSSSSSSTTNTTSNLDNSSKFNNRVLCRVACDMLRLQCDHSAYLVEHCPDMPRRIIEGLCHTLSLHIELVQQQNIFKEFKNLLLSIMFCLAHWCMSVPKDFLTSTHISGDYPNFVEEIVRNSPRNGQRFFPGGNSPTPSTGSQSAQPKTTLLDLVTVIFITISNMNVGEVLLRRFDRSTSENLNGLNSVGEMTTIDYSIQTNDFYNRPNDDHTPFPPSRRHPFTDSSPTGPGGDNRLQDANTIKKAAHLILLHFLNFMGHYPMPKLRTASLSALLNENDDNPNVTSVQHQEKIELEALNSPNVLVFVVNDLCTMSFIELPPDYVDSSSILSKLSTSTSSNKAALNLQKTRPIRIIIRNLLGKFAWDCIMLQSPILCTGGDKLAQQSFSAARSENNSVDINDIVVDEHNNGDVDDDDDDDEKSDSFLQSLKKDRFELMVNDIFEQNPECRSLDENDFLQKLNSTPEAVDTVALFTNQHFQESRFHEEQRFAQNQLRSKLSKITDSASLNGYDMRHSSSSTPSSVSVTTNTTSSSSSLASDPALAFQYCRQLIDQLGFLSWEKRTNINLLSKTQHTIRELRHLDHQRCRETHKIAVIYVAPGQETKDSILSNKSGSRTFEEFVSRLGWEVNLATHVGFMGGLESNLSTGLTAPFFADSFNEVIFHVSTRLEPANTASSPVSTVSSSDSYYETPDKQLLMTKKMRHLGNDEVHIVWSEHYKEYRRNILATEFCDALIVIYPLSAQTYPNLFRIQVSRKPEVPFFGPLFNGSVVHRDELPGLVRATAINASRAKRLYMTAYKHHFEERYDSIHLLATKHRELNTFEEYATQIYAPRFDLLTQQMVTAVGTNVGGYGDSSTMSDSIESTTVPTFTGVSSGTSTTTGFISIENFLNSVQHGLISSPSNADSISLASTGANSISLTAEPYSISPSSSISHHNNHSQNQQQQQHPLPPRDPVSAPVASSSPVSAHPPSFHHQYHYSNHHHPPLPQTLAAISSTSSSQSSHGTKGTANSRPTSRTSFTQSQQK